MTFVREAFEVGEEARLSKRISQVDIDTFARISGDNNPLHVDEEYAKSTMFGGRIAHGMLVAGLISAVLGTQLPGPGSVYVHQDMRFVAPVRAGDNVTAVVKVGSWDSVKGRVTLSTEVLNEQGKVVVAGSATLVMAAFLQKKN